MAEIISTGIMIKKLEGLLGTKDLSDREQEFVESMVRLRDSGEVTRLSDRQVSWLSDLHRKHFA
jgi:hypothetical protein